MISIRVFFINATKRSCPCVCERRGIFIYIFLNANEPFLNGALKNIYFDTNMLNQNPFIVLQLTKISKILIISHTKNFRRHLVAEKSE